jgi:hypothetical protein
MAIADHPEFDVRSRHEYGSWVPMPAALAAGATRQGNA